MRSVNNKKIVLVFELPLLAYNLLQLYPSTYFKISFQCSMKNFVYEAGGFCYKGASLFKVKKLPMSRDISGHQHWFSLLFCIPSLQLSVGISVFMNGLR